MIFEVDDDHMQIYQLFDDDDIEVLDDDELVLLQNFSSFQQNVNQYALQYEIDELLHIVIDVIAVSQIQLHYDDERDDNQVNEFVIDVLDEIDDELDIIIVVVIETTQLDDIDNDVVQNIIDEIDDEEHILVIDVDSQQVDDDDELDEFELNELLQDVVLVILPDEIDIIQYYIDDMLLDDEMRNTVMIAHYQLLVEILNVELDELLELEKIE